jgi:hypothetical protein
VSGLPGPISFTVQATAKPGVTVTQISALNDRLYARLGKPQATAYTSPALAPPGGEVNWSFTSGRAGVQRYAAAAKASGLFSSVVVRKG